MNRFYSILERIQISFNKYITSKDVWEKKPWIKFKIVRSELSIVDDVKIASAFASLIEIEASHND
jgi:hypothetical protein